MARRSHPLLRLAAARLSAYGPFTADDRLRMEQMQGVVIRRSRGADLSDLVEEGPHVILSGWACEMRPLANGGRQLFGFLIPGDHIGSFAPSCGFSFAHTVALTGLEVMGVRAGLAARDGGDGVYEHVAAAGVLAEARAGGHLYDHVVRLGAGNAYVGLAHLLLEFHDRFAAIGLATDGSFPFPLSQRILAQAMGLSVVHTNQSLHRLAADGLVELQASRARLFPRLRALVHAKIPDFGDLPAPPHRGDGRAPPHMPGVELSAM